MSSFSLHIATDNAAFAEDNICGEVARILRDLADELCRPEWFPRSQELAGETVRDVNGNTCGRWFWTDRYATHDDAAALDLITANLTGREWDAGDIERVAEVLTLSTGRTIASPA